MDSRNPDEPLSLAGELRRRRVLYTAVVYGISAFAVTEIAAFLFENFGAPAWADRLLAALFVAGFPVAMFLSWAFDIGADGIVRASAGGRRNRRTTIALAIGLLLLATGGLFYLIFPEPQPPQVSTGSATPPAAEDFGFEPAEKLENSIAVLPFENLSSEPDDVFFSTGVAEEVLNHLGGYRELNIIGRTSSFVFRDRDYPVPKISALLGVRFLLQGSVRRHQDQVRVSTQLLDDKGVQMWSRNFDRDLSDIFAIQTEIAVAVAQAVVPEITARSPAIRSANLDAYDLYLKGRDLLYHRVNRSAVEALEGAIELDPEFAPAHAELAIALAMGGSNQFIKRAHEEIDAALVLQPGLLRGLAARGLVLQQQDPPDWPGSEVVLRQVLTQDPNMTDALNWLSIAIGQQGREEESNEILSRALRLDPLHPSLVRNAAERAAHSGEDQRAIAIARRAIESPENLSFHPYVILFDLYSSRGNLVAAARVARERTEAASQISALFDPCYCMLIWVYSLLGDWELANYWLERSYRDFEDSYWADFFKVLTLQWRGRIRDALDAAQERYRQLHGQEDDFSVPALIEIGTLEALAGDYASAIKRLPPVLESAPIQDTNVADAIQALAWAYRQAGHAEKAGLLLDRLEQEYDRLRQKGQLRFQLREVHHQYALNAVLRGEGGQALDRLEAIVGWGWRMIYMNEQDPRWDALRDHPRFQALTALIKADVDRQRAELEVSAPHQAFVERLDALRSEVATNSE